MTALAAAFCDECRRIASSPIDLLLLTLMPLVLLGAMAAMIWGGSPFALGTVIVDRDGGALARAIARNVEATHTLAVVARTANIDAALKMIRQERAVAAVVIPQGVGTRGTDGAPVEIFHQAAFLSTGGLAATTLQSTIALTVVQWQARVSGLPGAAGARPLPLPGIQVTVLGNPNTSLEWYLGLLIGPALLHLLIAITSVASIVPLIEDGSFAAFARAAKAPARQLVGRLLPHVLAGTGWGIAWLLWLTLVGGYRADGSLLLIVVGLVLLFAATAGVSLLLVAASRSLTNALSGMTVIAGSALAYTGASLPVTGANVFTRIWSQVLPLTHYMTLQMDQVLGVAVGPFLRSAGALLLYPVIAGGLGVVLIRRAARP